MPIRDAIKHRFIHAHEVSLHGRTLKRRLHNAAMLAMLHAIEQHDAASKKWSNKWRPPFATGKDIAFVFQHKGERIGPT